MFVLKIHSDPEMSEVDSDAGLSHSKQLLNAQGC